MEYVQLTLDDWVEMKQKLKRELLGVKQSFVRIGYALRQIEDQKLYERDGYKTIAEFAKSEYGLEPSTTSRFMSINREYSVDGYSEHLRPEYAELGRSQLEEMLKLPDSDRQMIQPETSREDIRELKRFNKAEPAAGVADDVRQLIEKFFQDNKDLLKEALEQPEFTEAGINAFAELINPGGNRSYKKGLFFLMMYENRITIKKFGATPQDMTWWQFWQITKEIFGSLEKGSEEWQAYFGNDPDSLKDEKEETESTETPPEETSESADSKGQKEEIAPAQKPAETLEKSAVDGGENEPKSDPEKGENQDWKSEYAAGEEVVSTISAQTRTGTLKKKRFRKGDWEVQVGGYIDIWNEAFFKRYEPEETTNPHVETDEEQVPGRRNITEYPEYMPEPEVIPPEQTEIIDTATETPVTEEKAEPEESNMAAAPDKTEQEPTADVEDTAPAAGQEAPESEMAAGEPDVIQGIILEQIEALKRSVMSRSWQQALMDIEMITDSIDRAKIM